VARSGCSGSDELAGNVLAAMGNVTTQVANLEQTSAGFSKFVLATYWIWVAQFHKVVIGRLHKGLSSLHSAGLDVLAV
jgi:hypothetical protein